MKKYITGFLVGAILATTGFALASQPIKLIVNGKEIQCDVPPQVINGRTMVPARFLAEALGAKVEWDQVDNSVVVTSNNSVTAQPITGYQTSGSNVLQGNKYKLANGFEIELIKFQYSNSYTFQYDGVYVAGYSYKADEANKLFILTLNVNNNTDQYFDVFDINSIFQYIPDVEDGRKWDAGMRDTDHTILINRGRYLEPGHSLKVKMIGEIPNDINIVKLIVSGSSLGQKNDLEINVNGLSN